MSIRTPSAQRLCLIVSLGLAVSIAGACVSSAQEQPTTTPSSPVADAGLPAAAQTGLVHTQDQARDNAAKGSEPSTTAQKEAVEKPDKSSKWTALSSIAALIASLAALIVTPLMARLNANKLAAISARAVDVSEKQAATSLRSVEVADKNAQSAADNVEVARTNAAAAARNVEIAATNSANLGIHAVARLRQEWINDLRELIAEVHSLLGNYQNPSSDVPETDEDRKAREAQQRLANTKVAKIKLLLNPTEVPSRNLLDAIRILEKPGTLDQRMRRSKWLIVWGDIVLKEEWDRVRAELTGAERPQLTRRPRPARSFFAAALRGARAR